MARVFKIIPKQIKRSNGTFLTPEMVVVVTTTQNVNCPFSNGAKEIQETYKRIYNFDYKKANCRKFDFNVEILG